MSVSWVCDSTCLPINMGCAGACNIRPYLRRQSQRRAKQLRLFGGSDVRSALLCHWDSCSKPDGTFKLTNT